MSSLVEPYICHLDSDQRLSGTHSQFAYKITLPNRNYDRVAVLSASVPKSFYLVSESKSRPNKKIFILNEGLSSVNIELEDGNYSIRSLSIHLQAKLNIHSPGGFTYTVSYPGADDIQTGKLTFSVSGNVGLQPSIEFPEDSSMYKIMGFNQNSVNTFSDDVLYCNNVVVLSINEIFIKTNLVQAETNSVSDDIIASLNVINSPDYSAIAYMPNNIVFSSKPLSKGFSHTYNFIITDNDDQLLDLNGVSCNIDLVFFKWNDVPAMNKKNMMMSWYKDIATSALDDTPSISS